MATPILFVSASDALGGAELSLLELVAALRRRGAVDPHVVLPTPSHGDLGTALQADAVPTTTLPLPRLRHTANPIQLLRQWLGLRRAGEALARLAQTTGAAALHGNTLPAAVYACWARRHLKDTQHPTPVLWHHRDWSVPLALRPVLRAHVALCLTVSTSVAERLRPWFPPQRHALVPSSIAPAHLEVHPDPAAARRDLGLEPGSPLLLCVANQAPWKRHDLVLQTMARVRAEMPSARLLLAGRDIHAGAPQANRLAGVGGLDALARQLGIHDAVHARSFPRERMPEVYAAADILLHLAEGEPFGRAIVEALAAGLPVVAADEGGPAELLPPACGALTPPGDTAAAARAVCHLLRRCADHEERSRAGRAKAAAYTPDASAEAFERAVLPRLIQAQQRRNG